MAEQAVSNTVEYNKIHALALARKAVVKKFGTTLAHFWPMADDTAFIRDLMRQRPLYGKDIEVKASGMVDNAIKTALGYMSDVVENQGGTSYADASLGESATDYYLAVPIPEGRWNGVKFRSAVDVALTGAVIVAPPDTNPASVSADKLFQVNSVKESGAYIGMENTAAQSTTYMLYNGSSTTSVGQRLTLTIDLKRVIVQAYRGGSTPPGTVYCRVRRVSDGTVLGTASLGVTSLPTSMGDVTFAFATPVALNNDDVRVVIEYTDGNGTDGWVQVSVSNDSVDGTLTRGAPGSYYDDSVRDIRMKLYGEPALQSAVFPFPLDASEGQWWAYFKARTMYDTSVTERGVDGKTWGGSSWSTRDDVLAEFQGVGGRAWPSCANFSAAAMVNVDESPCDGTLLALSDATEAKVHLRVRSDKKVEATVKNTNGTTYTVTSVEILHPGYNLVAVTYEQNVAVSLVVNGAVVDTETPSDHPLFATAGNTLEMAVGVGAKVLTTKTVSDKLKDAFIDDVYLARGVMADSHWQDLFLHYLTAAPLMQVSDVSIEQVATE